MVKRDFGYFLLFLKRIFFVLVRYGLVYCTGFELRWYQCTDFLCVALFIK